MKKSSRYAGWIFRFLIVPVFQYRAYHGAGYLLLSGRSVLPQQVIRGDFRRVADIYKYGQAGHFCPALDLAEICCVYIAQFRKPLGRKSPAFSHGVDTPAQSLFFHLFTRFFTNIAIDCKKLYKQIYYKNQPWTKNELLVARIEAQLTVCSYNLNRIERS